MRVDRPVKAMRRTPVDVGENDEAKKPAGADGQPRRSPRRPGRTAALQGTAAKTRSQRWRNPNKGGGKMRRGTLAKGSRTGKNRSS